MSSKKYQIAGGAVWFPSRLADDVISLRYIRRSHSVELGALVEGRVTSTFRIPFAELLLALNNVPRADQS